MCYPDMDDCIEFLFRLLQDFDASIPVTPKRGRKKVYTDVSLIVFFAVMTLKGYCAFALRLNTGGCLFTPCG